MQNVILQPCFFFFMVETIPIIKVKKPSIHFPSLPYDRDVDICLDHHHHRDLRGESYGGFWEKLSHLTEMRMKELASPLDVNVGCLQHPLVIMKGKPRDQPLRRWLVKTSAEPGLGWSLNLWSHSRITLPPDFLGLSSLLLHPKLSTFK